MTRSAQEIQNIREGSSQITIPLDKSNTYMRNRSCLNCRAMVRSVFWHRPVRKNRPHTALRLLHHRVRQRKRHHEMSVLLLSATGVIFNKSAAAAVIFPPLLPLQVSHFFVFQHKVKEMSPLLCPGRWVCICDVSDLSHDVIPDVSPTHGCRKKKEREEIFAHMKLTMLDLTIKGYFLRMNVTQKCLLIVWPSLVRRKKS